MISKQGERFQKISDRYAQFRPRYPAEIVRTVADRLAAVLARLDQPVLDVGSGTGIFTEQLAAALGADIPVVAIEPSSKMREQAITNSRTPSVSYRGGSAEQLPVEDAGARGVLAATAAHWFDRPAFYREASRVLLPGGLLAIVEYVRDESSAAARAVIDFLARHGETRAYVRPDYVAELGGLTGFAGFEQMRHPVTLLLNAQEFAGLALSSSHARKVVDDLGEAEASAQLEAIGNTLADDDGKISYGYVFHAFMTTRAEDYVLIFTEK